MIALLSALFALNGCVMIKKPEAQAAVAAAAYCSTASVYAAGVTATGTAKYEYRAEGNGVIPSGNNVVKPTSAAAGFYGFDLTVTKTLDASFVTTPISYHCLANCSAETVVTGITNIVNGFGGPDNIKATGDRMVGLTPGTGYTVSIANLSNVSALNRNPIRFAEIKVTDASGAIIQCGETDSAGAYSLDLPNTGSTYTISILSRANNADNTAYILDTPTTNTEYALTASVVGSGAPTHDFIAPATGTLLGGAFNILDQILKAQEYLRSTTAGCSATFAQCTPFTIAPLIYVYWKKGVSPGVYFGIGGPISFYLNGEKQLYILGGVNGNTDVADMDHFDNSVIVHEYGHFIEDQFGSPDSPGGSHNGNAIIDPRLAWGEGWANFFQAAVRQDPYYRDTVGHVNCDAGVACTSVAFDEFLDPTGGSYLDKPTAGATGEGNFREFSVTRVLWDVVKTGGVSTFAEIWTAMNGSTSMRTVVDSFKSLGRFHNLQTALTGHTDWSSIATAEVQRQNMKDYGNPLTVVAGCAPNSTTMSIRKVPGDDGDPSTANLYQNNDFYIYNHPGGAMTAHLAWAGPDSADLDLYVYQSGYSYGSSTGRVGYSIAQTTATSGTEQVSTSLPAGQYIINVVGFTGNTTYLNNTSHSTTYSLTINGVTACPTF
jgi:hypothetical protein